MRIRERLAARRRGPRRWSLRTRLAVVSTVAVTVGLGVAGATAYLVTSRLLHEQVDDSLRSAPPSIGNRSPGAPDAPDPESLCGSLQSQGSPSPSLFAIAVVRPDGTVCGSEDSASIKFTQEDIDAATRNRTTLRDGELDDGHAARLAVILDDDGNVLIIARDTQSVVNVLTTLKLTLLGVTLLGALLALALSRWTSVAGLRPVTRFTRVAEQIAATGDLEHQVATASPPPSSRRGDELDRLAHAFDTMTRVLADAQVRQRRLVADAGHELRTPLSSLRNNISLLKRSRALGRALPAGEEDRLLADLSSQVAELSLLVDDLASLASTETEPAALREIRFDQCVERAVQRARNRSSGHVISARLEPWKVQGDPAGLERAAVNLLDNAIKFSPSGSEIHVDLAEGRLTVADRGEGVSEEESARAFERFWRSPRARSLPGSGLGLSIVDDVARQHDGWAQIAERPGGGVVATLFVPGHATR